MLSSLSPEVLRYGCCHPSVFFLSNPSFTGMSKLFMHSAIDLYCIDWHFCVLSVCANLKNFVFNRFFNHMRIFCTRSFCSGCNFSSYSKQKEKCFMSCTRDGPVSGGSSLTRTRKHS